MQLCNNCQNIGHLYYNCKKPITSLGIICYRITPSNKVEYLLIQRKDSLGYIDFIRGKYNETNTYQLKNIIYGMTDTEIDNICTKPYFDLWNNLGYKNTFDKKNEEKIINTVNTHGHLFVKNGWITPEWGFPKGRRNFKESDFEAALREFKEETGYSSNIKFIKNILPLEEIFTGSNLKSYKHRYFIGKMTYADSLCEVKFQQSEIGDMKWVEYEEAVGLLRDYNYEKINTLRSTNMIVKNYMML
jgi:8-oxo-dGTP pyrophosphatase MutT (NUDIX family)